MSDIFGSIVDFFSDAYTNKIGDERQEDAQQYGIEQQANQQNFNSAQAIAQRDFEERMSNTAMQRRKADLDAAGFNPLLALGAGGASTPQGAAASSGIAPAGMASPTPFKSVQAGLTSAAQAAAIQSQDERVKAETEKLRAEKDEVIARTGTHPVNIQATLQGIRESEERIKNIIQNTETSANTAQNIAQQTVNLKAAIPQIEEHVKQLQALTVMNYAQAQAAGAAAQLSQGQFTEVVQRVKENLPAVEAALIKVKTTNTGLETAGLRSRENLHGGENTGQKLGTILELGKALSNMIPSFGILLGGKK